MQPMASVKEEVISLRNGSFALYRILGNDLPPRHSPSQTIQNLLFTLQNEPALPDVDRWWVLNRIVDAEKEDTLMQILELYGQHYIRIPFIESDYSHIQLRLNDFGNADHFHHPSFLKLSLSAQWKEIDYTLHDKNRYIMNNNGGRNTAIRHGRAQGYKWIFPLDGNAFITADAWDQIKGGTIATDAKYVIIPMARIVENTMLLDPAFKPEAPEEPQIGFRDDALLMFDEKLRYGRRPKVSLVYSLISKDTERRR